MKANPICRVCKVVLDSENWYVSQRKNRDYVCKRCCINRVRLWQEDNPEKYRVGVKDRARETRRKAGVRPFSENKECAMFLGVHVAERVMSRMFKDVQVMPYGNVGYDIICNHGKLIDIKSSCIHKDKRHNSTFWSFDIRRNTTADFFLCLAFDNREDLNPLHAWLIPGAKLNHLKSAGISPGTIHKWNEYRLDISKINTCCDTLKRE